MCKNCFETFHDSYFFLLLKKKIIIAYIHILSSPLPAVSVEKMHNWIVIWLWYYALEIIVYFLQESSKTCAT